MVSVTVFQHLAPLLACASCRGPVMFQLATQPMSVDGDVEDFTVARIAAGDPYLACRAYVNDDIQAKPQCSLRYTAKNSRQLREAVESARNSR